MREKSKPFLKPCIAKAISKTTMTISITKATPPSTMCLSKYITKGEIKNQENHDIIR